MKVLDITAANGVPFRVVLYAPGETGPYPAAKSDEHELVEFYDARYPHTEHGQFVSRYRLETLLEGVSWHGLNLDGGIDAWTIDADSYEVVRSWLRHHATTRARQQHDPRTPARVPATVPPDGNAGEPIPQAEAEQFLAALMRQHDAVIDAVYAKPELKRCWDDREWVILWEEGPHNWAYLFPHGGIEEEFGFVVHNVSEALPDGLFAEPINAYSVGIYRS